MLPLGRERGLAGIDRGDAVDLHQPQVILGNEYPDLGLRPGRGRVRPEQLGDGTGLAGHQGERVTAGAHLHPQAAVGLEPGRQRTLQ